MAEQGSPQSPKVFYRSPTGIEFIRNPNDWYDGQSGYHVRLPEGKGNLYIPSRALRDLADLTSSTDEVVSRFDNMTGGTASYILDEGKVDRKDLHIALLRLRMAELEEERREMILSSTR